MKKRKIIFLTLIIGIILIISFSLLLILLKNSSETHSDNGVFTIPSWGNGAPALTINLTPEFVMTKSKGIDFSVYYFYNEKEDTNIGVYLGHNPSLFSEDFNQTKLNGTIQNIRVKWHTWNDETRGKIRLHREAIIRDFFPDENTDYEGLMIHVFMEGNTTEEIDKLQKYTETIRILE